MTQVLITTHLHLTQVLITTYLHLTQVLITTYLHQTQLLITTYLHLTDVLITTYLHLTDVRIPLCTMERQNSMYCVDSAQSRKDFKSTKRMHICISFTVTVHSFTWERSGSTVEVQWECNGSVVGAKIVKLHKRCFSSTTFGGSAVGV